MIAFKFEVNHSFKYRPEHPITVPRRQVDYAILILEGLDSGELTIRFPQGERARAYMYSHVAGWGPYYQVRTRAGEEVPDYIQVGDFVLVTLTNNGVLKTVTVERTN